MRRPPVAPAPPPARIVRAARPAPARPAAARPATPTGSTATLAPPRATVPPEPEQTAHDQHDQPDLHDAGGARRAVRAATRSRRTVEAQERRRFTRRSRGIRRATVAALGVGVLLVAVPVLLAVTPVFAVRTIEVPGASAPVAAAVRAGLAGQLGRPVALVPDAAVAQAIAAVPAVERFTVERLPPGALEVRVVERTPVAQVQTADGYATVDAAQVTMATSAARDPSLPLVAVPAAPGGGPAFRAAAAAIAAVRAVPGIPLRRVTATTADDVTLTLAGGRSVLWGGVDSPAAKAEALRAALVRAAAGTTVIDVSSPGVVTTR